MGLSQFVIFKLGKEEYGIEIGVAQEIIRIPEQITKMANMPSFFEGMINLRGKIIPVIDLNKKFGNANVERDVDSRLLILDLDSTLLGTIVEDVSEVIMLEEDSIEKLNFGLTDVTENFIKGVAKKDDRLIVLLDVLKFKSDIFKYSN